MRGARVMLCQHLTPLTPSGPRPQSRVRFAARMPSVAVRSTLGGPSLPSVGLPWGDLAGLPRGYPPQGSLIMAGLPKAAPALKLGVHYGVTLSTQ